MKTDFWRALDQLGAHGAAARDWRQLLGDEWESCRPFLKQVPGNAETVLDPVRPSRRLDVVPDGAHGFLGIVADDAPDGPPYPLSADDVALLTPDWKTIADALGKALGFAANRYENQGLTRQIGTAQNGSDPIRPVVLCLPAGHFGDHGRMLSDLASRRDATIILPTARWITPPIQALASANRLSLESVAEKLMEIAATAAVPALATPPPVAGSKKPRKPLLVIQPGWRWGMVTVEVAIAGRIIVACDGQRKEHRLRKSKGHNHSEDYAILMQLASKPLWRNPPSDAADHEKVRRRFRRLGANLVALLPLPGKPFDRDGKDWKPNFKVILHSGLRGVMKSIEEETDADDLSVWHHVRSDD